MTCPLATSASSSFIYYDEPRNFTFQTTSSSPDVESLTYSYVNTNRTIVWKNPFYLGPDYYYELFTKYDDTEKSKIEVDENIDVDLDRPIIGHRSIEERIISINWIRN